VNKQTKRRAPKRKQAQSQATQRSVGTNQHSEGDGNKNGVTISLTGSRNDATYAERRLRNDRPDLYALRQLLRSDRKRTGGWVRLGKMKGAYA
jgi:hypothetical protein